jgi:hypothetical protein
MYRYLTKKTFSSNPYQSTAFSQLKVGSQSYNYYDINKLNSPISKRFFILPFLLRQVTLLNQSPFGKRIEKLR